MNSLQLGIELSRASKWGNGPRIDLSGAGATVNRRTQEARVQKAQVQARERAQDHSRSNAGNAMGEFTRRAESNRGGDDRNAKRVRWTADEACSYQT